MTIREKSLYRLDDIRRTVDSILPEWVKRSLRRPYRLFESLISAGVVTKSAAGLTADFKATNLKTHRYRMIEKERPVIEDMAEELSPDDVFYDVGANIGIYSCLLATSLSDGTVHAFEPHPANAERLRENVRLNEQETSIHEVALSDTNGWQEFVMRDEQVGTTHAALIGDGTDTNSKIASVSGTATRIRASTLDTFVTEEDVLPPTVLKIDVEGAEYDVLTGAEETLTKEGCRLVYCECHPRHLPEFDATMDEVIDRLNSYGFSTDVVYDHRDETGEGAIFVKAKK